jgi:phospholipase/carboxylesterase
VWKWPPYGRDGGRTDPIASPAQTAALAALLRQAGADVTLFQHDGGHQITPGEVRAARDWLRQHDFRTS